MSLCHCLLRYLRLSPQKLSTVLTSQVFLLPELKLPPMPRTVCLSARHHRPTFLLAGLAIALLSSCTPSGDPIAQTTCTAAYAEALYTWRVNYWTSRTSAAGQRWEEFSRIQLLTPNGVKPTGAVTGPDDNEVWYPKLPPRPTPDEMDARRRPGEMQDPPEMLTTVNYSLECVDGRLNTDRHVYRQVAKAIRSGATPAVNYTLGRALSIVDSAPSPPPQEDKTPR